MAGAKVGPINNVLGSLFANDPPPAPGAATDPAALKERISAVVSGLLGLVGIPADALKSREHILLSSILDAFWEGGRSLDLAGLIGAVQKPPFQKVGVFDLETFYPAKERFELAMRRSTCSACCIPPRASRASRSCRSRTSPTPSACSW